MNHNTMDYLSHCEDEIALEGLDGITLEGLWLRLASRHNFSNTLTLDDKSKEFIWSLIVQDEEIGFFCLEKTRPPLKIFNRYEYIDAEMGIVYEAKGEVEDLYPFHPIRDRKNDIRGSCSTYETRKDITNDVVLLSLQEAETRYGNQLVMVASQILRNKALCLSAVIDKFYDISLYQYIMLERIGRSRTLGEITNGKNSLAVMNIAPKTMFYYRKRLLKVGLITKQVHRQRSLKGIISSSSLLHLPRFYVSRRPKYIMILQKVVEILKGKPDYRQPFNDLKRELGMPDVSAKKMFKNAEFQKFFHMVMVPYRQIHPDAPESEWRYKVRDEEKSIRCLQLVNPDVTLEDILQDEEEGEDPDEDETSSGIIDQSKLIWGRSLLQQGYMGVEAAGPEGVSQNEMGRQLGLKKLEARSICRSLQKRKVIHSLMKDIGRQRVSRYVSNRFASTGHLLQEFETERKKMLEFVPSSDDKAANEEKDVYTFREESSPSTSKMTGSEAVNESDIGMEMTRSDSEATNVLNDDSPQPSRSSKGNVMDESETINCTEDSDGKEKPLHASSAFDDSDSEKQIYINHKKVSPQLTTKIMRRINIIMKEVVKKKVIDDPYKLLKLIVEAEQMEGSSAKMDKRSLMRLLERLSKAGFLKKIEVKIKTESKLKEIIFVVHSSITLKSNLLMNAIEQQKHKFLMHSSLPKKRSLTGPPSKIQDVTKDQPDTKSSSKVTSIKAKIKDDPSLGESMRELEMMHNLSSEKEKSVPINETIVTGVKGNMNPKFVRMQEFHKLLFYLVYGYEGITELDQDAAWDTIVESCSVDLTNETRTDYPTMYLPEVSWKMFIPPLRKYQNFPNTGWVFLVEVLIRLPLCIFVEVVTMVNPSKQLTDYLNHPIKQNILLKHLPTELRRLLLNGRRYLNYIMELCRKLCYVGLLQQGSQVTKEKDQLFVYLNRRATLIDTTVSNPGYHHISMDKEYVRKEYSFYTLEDVIQYWYDMWTICMHTPLGSPLCMQGKKVTIQMLSKKPEMIESHRARSFEEAPLLDDGRIPGDQTGAAGLDSSLYAHLKRNWSVLHARFPVPCPSSITTTDANGENSSNPDKMFSYAQYLRNSCQPTSDAGSSSKSRLSALRNVRLSLFKPKREGEDGKPLKVSIGLVHTSKKRKRESNTKKEDEPTVNPKPKRKKTNFQREIKPRPQGPKKPYYDEEDKAALQRMNKLRVDWYPAEDSMLLLCKVASAYLFPNRRTKIFNFCIVRDLLHKWYPESRNKTSRACQRRINYIMKNPATEENVAVILDEVKQDEEITRDFKPAKLSHKLPVLHKMCSNIFKEFVERLVSKYASNKSKQVPDLPNTYPEFESKFKIIQTSHSLSEGPKLEEIKSASDIDRFLVNALIFSSLCTKQDRESWAFQLYLAYQKYPQTLLNSVLSSIRESKMISYKKCYNRSKYIRTCLPISTSPFQLSFSFVYVFHLKYQYDIFGDCWNVLKGLVDLKSQFLLSNDDVSHSDPPKDWEESLETQLDDKSAATRPKRRKPPKIGARGPSKKARREAKETAKKLALKRESQCRSSLMERTEDSEGNQDCCDDEELETSDSNEEKGLSLPVDIKGGCCAAVIALAVTKRLVFDIVIPDQIIFIDNQQDQEALGPNKLLEKVKYYEMVSGRSFSISEELQKNSQRRPCGDEYMYDEREEDTAANLTVCDNVDAEESSTGPNGKLSDVQPVDAEDFTQMGTISSESKRKLLPEDEDTICKKRLKSSCSEDRDEETTLETEDEVLQRENEDIKPKSRTQHSKSRVGMYMLREHLLSGSEMPTPNYWAFDNILINTCEISCRLRQPPDANPLIPTQHTPDDIMNTFMPIAPETLNQALTARKRVVLNDYTKLEPALSRWKEEGRTDEFLSLVQKIYAFIESKKELGASAHDIKEMFPIYDHVGIQPMKVLREMENVTLVLRVGIDTFRWVAIQFSKVWLIRTNKMSRAKMLSSESVRLSGVYEVKTNEDSDQGKKNKDEITTVDQGNAEVDDQGKAQVDKDNASGEVTNKETAETEAVEVTKPGKSNLQNLRPRKAVLNLHHRKDSTAIENVEKALDEHLASSQHEEIDVMVRPWVRLNGCLNRRVMDRMLGAVLCYIMEQPGVTGLKIAERFWPALQPAHTYELVDTLFLLKAVKRFYVKKSHKVGLFTKPQQLHIEPAEDFDYDDNMMYEAEVDSILRLSMFIGDKKYTQEFLSSCR